MHIQFAELPVFDQDRAKTFYMEHFDCQTVADQPMGQDGWRWIELRFPHAETTLHFHPRRNEEPTPSPVLVLVDEQAEDIVARLRSRGVEIITNPQPAHWRPGVMIAEFRDSEGNRIVVSGR